MNKKKLVSKIRKEFPDCKFEKTKLITKGWDHDVLVLDNKFIFRFAKKRLYKKSLVREVKFLRDFSVISNLKVPNYTLFSKDKTFGGYEMIKGRELTPRIYKNLSFQKKQKIITDLAKFITTLHKIPLKKAKQYGFEKYTSWKQEVKKQQRWFENEFKPKVSKKLTAQQNDFIENFFQMLCNTKYSIKPTLGHFDLSYDHIIMKKDGKISGVIDFGDTVINDPAIDFNGFYDYSEKMPAQIYKLYKGPKDSKFMMRAKNYSIGKWIYFLYGGLVRRKDKALWKEANNQLNKIISSFQ